MSASKNGKKQHLGFHTLRVSHSYLFLSTLTGGDLGFLCSHSLTLSMDCIGSVAGGGTPRSPCRSSSVVDSRPM
jgi:hypothetical protein